MSIAKLFLGVTLSFGLVIGASACGSVKVDCDKMCTRTFKECVGEVMVGSGKMTKKQLELVKKAGALKKMQEKGYEACMKDCKKKKGIGSDAGKINKCLKKSNCKEYADCIKKHLK